ncbi:MAG: methyltransferase domain-containing protein [Elusimicrobia bacterium]|nr:methyltransferase domain-containing protein [Elusimicrobiota bacterium]
MTVSSFSNPYGSLIDYYRDQIILPTYCRFTSGDDLEKHQKERGKFFTERLSLPAPRFFQGARLIEFGPDSGENALAFATWGASCFLVEPNKNAHPVLLDYFDRFNLSHQIAGLSESNVTAFHAPGDQKSQYDVVDAEGFIYTVRPEKQWMDLFSFLLKPGGVVILSYMEKYGSFFELFLRVIHNHVRRLTGIEANRSARDLYLAKWNSIPHTRSFESWVMDVIENPFVRLHFLFEPYDLCRKMSSSGFTLYSSWPFYRNALELGWHKKRVSALEQLDSTKAFLHRSRVSHFFGVPLFSVRPSLETCLEKTLHLVDGLIDNVNEEAVKELKSYLADLSRWVEDEVLYARPSDRKKALLSIVSVKSILDLLVAGDVHALKIFCNTDAGFTGMWGMPVHYSVFEKQ